jgi:Skp family chaperone for outer membrane proteins
MKKFNKFLLILTFFFASSASSSELIAFLDMDFIMNQSKAGIQITKELSKNHKANIENFKKQEEFLKEEEKKIIAQKNILDKAEFEKKIVSLREKANKYRIERKEIIDNLTKKKIQATAKLLDQIRPILAEYSANKSISIIIEKKNIIIGKSELDITKDILSIVDKKISKIKIN